MVATVPLHGRPSVDILPLLKQGDSHYWRSMSRTEKDIESGVLITVMSETARAAYPISYSKVCDTFRPRRATARRTDLGRHAFVDFLKPCAVLKSFIAEHMTEGRPTRIQYGFGQVGFGQTSRIHVTDGNVIKLLHQFPRCLVQKIGTLIHNLGVDRGYLAAFVGALRDAQLGFQRTVVAFVLNLLDGV